MRMSSADSPVRGAGAADAARGDEHLVDVSCPVEDFGEGLLVSAVTGNVRYGVVGILSQARAVHPGEGGLQPVGVARRWQPSGRPGWYTGGSGSRVAKWPQSGSASHDGSAGTGLLSDRRASQLHELFGAHRNGAGQKGQRCPTDAVFRQLSSWPLAPEKGFGPVIGLLLGVVPVPDSELASLFTWRRPTFGAGCRQSSPVRPVSRRRPGDGGGCGGSRSRA